MVVMGKKRTKHQKILGVTVDILFLLSSMKLIQDQFLKVQRQKLNNQNIISVGNKIACKKINCVYWAFFFYSR